MFADAKNEIIFENEIDQIKKISDSIANRGIGKKKDGLKNISDVFAKDVRLTR